MKLESSMYIIFVGCIFVEMISGLMFGSLENIYYPFLNDRIPYSTICTNSINPINISHIVKDCKSLYFSDLGVDKKNVLEIMYYAFVGVACIVFIYGIYIWQRMIKQYRINLIKQKETIIQ